MKTIKQLKEEMETAEAAAAVTCAAYVVARDAYDAAAAYTAYADAAAAATCAAYEVARDAYDAAEAHAATYAAARADAAVAVTYTAAAAATCADAAAYTAAAAAAAAAAAWDARAAYEVARDAYDAALKTNQPPKESIDWLYDNLKSHFAHDGDLLEVIQMSFEQSKAMHKEEITQAWKKGDGEFDNCAKKMSLE